MACESPRRRACDGGVRPDGQNVWDGESERVVRSPVHPRVRKELVYKRTLTGIFAVAGIGVCLAAVTGCGLGQQNSEIIPMSTARPNAEMLEPPKVERVDPQAVDENTAAELAGLEGNPDPDNPRKTPSAIPRDPNRQVLQEAGVKDVGTTPGGRPK